MRIKGIVDEDFSNYKEPSMLIITSTCSFKCDIESGESCCQNSSLANDPTFDIPIDEIIERYMDNPITKAIVFGGLEPFDQLSETWYLIDRLRKEYECDDTVVIYTGYTEEEVGKAVVDIIGDLGNIIVKYGRFVPYKEKHYDEILGVDLASPNQYAKRY